jgi:hypothetical protein
MPESGRGGTSRVTRAVSATAVAVPLLAGVVGLVFTVRPGLKPCLGGSEASFTGAPVFPRVHFHDHLIRTGVPREVLREEPNLTGAEIRFSYRVSGFRGAHLPVTWSLVRIERDGTLGAVVRGQDRALAMTVTPDTCSEGGGHDLFVQVPAPAERYRVVLELYRTERLEDRLALLETAIFNS